MIIEEERNTSVILDRTDLLDTALRILEEREMYPEVAAEDLRVEVSSIGNSPIVRVWWRETDDITDGRST